METLTGGAGIASGEQFGNPDSGQVQQVLITGSAGIPSGERFPRRSGVFTEPLTQPVAIWIAY